MSTLLERVRAIQEEAKPPVVVPEPEKPSFYAVRDGPRNSADLERVLALPRRQLVLEGPEAEHKALEWTTRLKRAGGTMTLRPIQAVALADAEAAGGLLGLIGVGFGKTLISLLLPTVWGVKSAALLVPPNLKTKLLEFEYPELSKHWRLPNLDPALPGAKLYPDSDCILYVISYNDLSSPKQHDILERLRPEALICDEAHSIRRSTAARTKRFKRYAKKAKPKLAALSGTLTSKSINDYAHIAEIALKQGSPLPLDWPTLQEWSFTLDANDFPAPDGELRRWCKPGEDVREGYRRRLVETPGVVATTVNDPGMSLVFSELPLKVPKTVADALQRLRETWERPDGHPLAESLEFYAVARQIACGFYYRRIYPRHEPIELIREWEECQREYFREVRDRLKLSIPGQDSYLFLWNAAESGKWASKHFPYWKAIHKEVQPDKETVWLDRFLVNAAVDWAKESPGIIWAEAEAVKAAFVVAEEANIPVYVGGDKDARAIQNESGKRSIVAGVKGFKQGINIQGVFSRNLILCLSDETTLEQTIGRTHRPGQPEDEVTVDFCLHTPELVETYKKALNIARYKEQTTGSRAKILMANCLPPLNSL